LNLGVFNSALVFFSYLKIRLFPSRKEESFEKWVLNRFGSRLYRIFFKHYTEKIWGIPCRHISSDWASQRIKGLSLSSAVRNALCGGRNNRVKTLIREFGYPSRGAGMMYEAAAAQASQHGAELLLNLEVVRVIHDHKKVVSVVCRDSATGGLTEFAGTDFCSSMPLDELVRRMDPSPRQQVACDVRQAHLPQPADGLSYPASARALQGQLDNT
jgi:protoporphyrinogen oxidase